MLSVSAAQTGVGLSDLWALVPGPSDVDPEAHRVLPATAPLASGYRVAEIAGSTVASATLAAADAGLVRGAIGRADGPDGGRTETDHALAAWRTYVLIDGRPPPMWADLSGRYAAGDRHVQLHCNFPHHAAGVAARLGVEENRAAFEAAITERDPVQVPSPPAASRPSGSPSCGPGSLSSRSARSTGSARGRAGAASTRSCRRPPASPSARATSSARQPRCIVVRLCRFGVLLMGAVLAPGRGTSNRRLLRLNLFDV